MNVKRRQSERQVIPLPIYATAITAIAIILSIKVMKWKIATRAITLFCKENFREPTDKEIADYTERAADKTFKFKGGNKIMMDFVSYGIVNDTTKRNIDAEEIEKVKSEIISTLQEHKLTYSESKIILERTIEVLGDYSIIKL